MRHHRIRWQPVLIFIVAWALSGCRDGSNEATVLRFWAMGREGEVVRQLLLDFEHTHPGVRVEVQQLPWTAAHQKLLTAFAGGALPDVAQLGNTWLAEFVALHAVDTVEPSVVDASDYFPGIWQTNVIDEAAYGVPWYVDTRLCSIAATSWPRWDIQVRRPLGRNGSRCSARSRDAAGRNTTPFCYRSTSTSRCWRWRYSKMSRCSATRTARQLSQ